jgi:hypothetical protein
VDTIYVSIAAYRDPQLVPTIEDCLARAAHPERLRFGVCWQHGPEEGPLPWAGDSRFNIIEVGWQDSRGACWARAELMRRYAGERWFLQLDSHHRFAERWDEKLIAQAGRTASTRPIVTTYATPFDPAAPDVRGVEPMQMNFDRFTPEGIALFRPGVMRHHASRDRPQRARFVSAHFLFAAGSFVRDVPYDPELYFIGEEITLTVRAFTHGYDLFHPAEVIVWHEYTREHRAHKHWTDHRHDQGVPVAWYELDRASLEKVQRFLAAPQVAPFGLGPSRTLAEYEAYAGLHFGRRRAQDYTRQGLDPPNPRAEDDWAERIRSYTVQLNVEKSRLPADVDDYGFWYVGVHDARGQEIFRLDADPAEIRTLLDDDAPTAVVRRSFESDRDPASWVVWPVSRSRGWLDRIEGWIPADHR